MQKLHHERNLLQEKELQNNPRLWKPFQNQNATENGNRLGTKNLQKRSKTAELPFAHIKQNMKLHEFTTTGIKTQTQNSNYIQSNTT